MASEHCCEWLKSPSFRDLPPSLARSREPARGRWLPPKKEPSSVKDSDCQLSAAHQRLCLTNAAHIGGVIQSGVCLPASATMCARLCTRPCYGLKVSSYYGSCEATIQELGKVGMMISCGDHLPRADIFLQPISCFSLPSLILLLRTRIAIKTSICALYPTLYPYHADSLET